MLDTRETNILRHVLDGRPGLVAERLARRLGDGPVDPRALTAEERSEGAAALEAFAARKESLGGPASSLARDLRAIA